MQENNKKTLILSVLGVLVLIIAVVGVSFAMYSFSAAGTRENVIKTGTASLDFSGAGSCTGLAEGQIATDYEDCENKGGNWVGPNTIALTNEYPKTDEEGLTNDAATFDLVADFTGDMTINYALQFVDITPGNTLSAGDIKVQVKKTAGETVTYPMGTATTGVQLSSISATTNTLTGSDGYVFDSGTLTSSGTISYAVKAWVADTYNLAIQNPEYTGTCSIEEHTTANACATAGGTWTQSKATDSETFSFKIRVVAAQNTGA